MTRDLLAMFGFLAFIGGMVLLSEVALHVHRNRHRGRLWSILETIRSFLADECKSSRPNAETRKAMQDADAGRNLTRHGNVAELFEDCEDREDTR